MDFLKDLWSYSQSRKKYWLLPTIVTLLVLGVLVVVTGGSAISPFIYIFW